LPSFQVDRAGPRRAKRRGEGPSRSEDAGLIRGGRGSPARCWGQFTARARTAAAAEWHIFYDARERPEPRKISVSLVLLDACRGVALL